MLHQLEKYFILTESVHCKDMVIMPKNGSVYFCFFFEVTDYFPENRPLEEINKIAKRIQNLEYFTVKSKGNYICKVEDFKDFEEDWHDYYHMFINKGHYFFNNIELLKYCFKLDFFSLDSLSKDIKLRIIELLKISDAEIKELREIEDEEYQKIQ